MVYKKCYYYTGCWGGGLQMSSYSTHYIYKWGGIEAYRLRKGHVECLRVRKGSVIEGNCCKVYHFGKGREVGPYNAL